MLFFGANGYRVIAHDRRGHGRSDQPSDGNNMDQYADDLAELIEKLDLRNAILVGHSTGGGEVAHYIGRHGSNRVAKVVLVGAVPPLMLKGPGNPEGVPLEVFDSIRAGVATNRSQFYYDLTMPFYGFNRAGAQVNEGLRESFRLHRGSRFAPHVLRGFLACLAARCVFPRDVGRSLFASSRIGTGNTVSC